MSRHLIHTPAITPEDHGHLFNIGFGGLMRKVTPDHIADDLIKRGLARHATGGLMLTEAGHMAMATSNGIKKDA